MLVKFFLSLLIVHHCACRSIINSEEINKYKARLLREQRQLGTCPATPDSRSLLQSDYEARLLIQDFTEEEFTRFLTIADNEGFECINLDKREGFIQKEGRYKRKEVMGNKQGVLKMLPCFNKFKQRGDTLLVHILK